MLTLTIHGEQSWNSELEEFVYSDTIVLELEHSLISLSKWESFWEKPFLGDEEKSTEETLGYIQAMCLTPNVPPDVFLTLTNEHLAQVNTYINAKMSATWFTEAPGRPVGSKKKVIITAELLYYWIFSAEIEAKVVEQWHLNRLFTLLKVFNEKNKPVDKKSKANKADAMAERRLLNAQRKSQYNTTG